MPEIPDLEGYAAYFNKRLPGLTVRRVDAPIAWMVRAGREEFEERLEGHIFLPVRRRAKLLLFPFQCGDNLVVHAMLSGRYQYAEPSAKRPAMTAWVLGLDNDMELRYFDQRRMGRTYLVRDGEFAEKVPRWSEMGPDVLSPELTEDEFVRRLSPMRGMIKNIITNERCIAGIGNAYSDEVLWEARLHPFRKRTDISEEQIRELYRSIRRVMEWATPIVAELMEAKGLPAKMYRDHLRVHHKADGTCPRDGHRISAITSGGRETNFCRACQE
ncbi:MAG: Fpg/Nei family DNA glycosylase [Chloroflexi bacterium]|nr:MAG: Fpg/Nei family DNA glycosylase [Chloroflexota bacterium]